jgi:hypothetical protein
MNATKKRLLSVLTVCVLTIVLTFSFATKAFADCETSTEDQVSNTAKYGKVKFKDPYRSVKASGVKSQFVGRIYFRPRNGSCFVSVNPRNGDVLVGTGDLEHPGCDSDKWGWWDIKWTDEGGNGQFDTMVDFAKTQYKIALIAGKNGAWELCMDN